jgi:cytochrome c oxidase assembly protein Cox11
VIYKKIKMKKKQYKKILYTFLFINIIIVSFSYAMSVPIYNDDGTILEYQDVKEPIPTGLKHPI